MSEYVVSARKYRPQTFNSVVGQRHITQTLQSAIASNHLAHAYLFTGPRGVGKTTCARIFARAINCLNPTENHDACGECESCVAFAADRSFNIHEMDAASNNSVDDIRVLNDKVRVAPQIGKYSVYIIDEAHMLSSNAFNAFLKTLEEPPAHAIFIMATTEKHKILPTILSHCQIYDFNRIRLEDIVEYLQHIAVSEGVSYDDESLDIIAQRADGGMRDALSTFDRVVSFCGSDLKFAEVAECVGALDYNTYFSCVDMGVTGDYGALLVAFDTILGKGFDGGHFLAGIAEHFRNLLVAKNPNTVKLLEVSGSVAKRYSSQAEGLEVAYIFGAINLFSVAESTYRGATSRRLHVELALMKLAGLNSQLGGGNQSATLPHIAKVEVAKEKREEKKGESPTAEPKEVIEVSESEPKVEVSTVEKPKSSVSVGGGSMLGISISQSRQQKEQGDGSTEQKKPQLTPEQGIDVLRKRFSELAELWKSRHKTRIAQWLDTAVITEQNIEITVPSELMEMEIMNSMVDIERDMIELFNFRMPITIKIAEQYVAEKPVTMAQKIEKLVEINPKILKLQEELDLAL